MCGYTTILYPLNIKAIIKTSKIKNILWLKDAGKANEVTDNTKENKTNKILNWILSPIKANIIAETHPVILYNAPVICK